MSIQDQHAGIDLKLFRPAQRPIYPSYERKVKLITWILGKRAFRFHIPHRGLLGSVPSLWRVLGMQELVTVSSSEPSLVMLFGGSEFRVWRRLGGLDAS
jgi:hypothetical protein